MWKLALNHAKKFFRTTNCGCSESMDNSDSGWDHVLLAQKINKQGVAIKMSWYA